MCLNFFPMLSLFNNLYNWLSMEFSDFWFWLTQEQGQIFADNKMDIKVKWSTPPPWWDLNQEMVISLRIRHRKDKSSISKGSFVIIFISQKVI